MNFTLQYCLRKLQEEYFVFAANYKVALAKFGKTARITEVTKKNTISGVNKFLTLKTFIRDHESYKDILLRIKNSRIGMNNEGVREQLNRVDGLFRYREDGN